MPQSQPCVWGRDAVGVGHAVMALLAMASAASFWTERLAMSTRRQKMDRPRPTLTEIEQWPATVDVPTAGVVFGLSRSHSYELVSRGEFPVKVIRVGSRYRVVTASIIDVLSSQAA